MTVITQQNTQALLALISLSCVLLSAGTGKKVNPAFDVGLKPPQKSLDQVFL